MTPDTAIREATQADLPFVIDLAVEAVLHSTSPFRPFGGDLIKRYRREDLQGLYQALSDPNFKAFVLFEDDELIGHVLVHCGHRDSATGVNQAWIYDLSVRPGYWNAGIGKRLMARAEEFARGLGIGAIGLGVTISNERAVKFYHGLGYLDERVQMFKPL
jgi:GNAT superfamily N-acetyltransferase